MNTEPVESALTAAARRLVVLADDETDELVRDMVEVLTLCGARLYGRRSARKGVVKAVGCAQRDIGPPGAVLSGTVGAGGQRRAMELFGIRETVTFDGAAADELGWRLLN